LTDTDGAPRSVGRAGSRAAPLGAVIGALGNWGLGVRVMTARGGARSLPRPSDVVADETSLTNDLYHRYDYRYAGIAGSYRRDTIALGAARRFGDSLALGASLGLARVHVTEH